MLINKKQLINLQLIALLLVACNSDYIPKPRGYFRIDLPEKSYQPWQNNCPFTFEYNKMALVTADTERLSEPCWLNIDYPKHKATIHLSYKPVENNIEQFLEDARTLVYKHTVKASDINETLVRRDSAKVYGLIYDLEGGAASPYQFYLTDSTNHFV
ncbi:MAG: gliding motility lipoprotein GldD, partial [Flavobacteriales bacterium]